MYPLTLMSFLFFSFCALGYSQEVTVDFRQPDVISKTPGLPEMKYYVIQLKATQLKASVICKTFGTELVSIADANTNSAITSLIMSSGDRYWTSGRKLPSGKWIWWYQLAQTYTNWELGHNNNDSSRSCLQLLPTGEWSSEACEKEQYFICEGPKVAISC